MIGLVSERSETSQPAAGFPTPPAHHRLTRRIAGDLRRHCGLEAGERLLVAVSGGADSVALLRALAALAERRRWRLRLSVAHVQHHLRGDAAEHDARFVEGLARELGLDCHRTDLEPAVAGEGRNLEAWARRQRYAALARMADEAGARFIVTAHHADDQLETLLMRLVRGTSVRGLRGIAWRRAMSEASATLLRPMLGATRAEVLDFLHAVGQPWCEDHTNADVTRDRARLRQVVLPVLHALRDDAPQQAVRLADHARDVHRLVRREVGRQFKRLVRVEAGQWSLPRDEARALPRVVLMGLLRRVLREAGVPGDRLTRAAVGPVAQAVRDGRGGERRFELAGGVRVGVRREGVAVWREGPGTKRSTT